MQQHKEKKELRACTCHNFEKEALDCPSINAGSLQWYQH